MGGWTVEDARDAEQRERLLEEERSFVAYCPRALDELAHAAIKFSVALLDSVQRRWEDSSKILSEARGELVAELELR